MAASLLGRHDGPTASRAGGVGNGGAPAEATRANLHGALPTRAFLLERWSEIDGQPRVVLGDDLEVLWSNAAADEAFAEAREVILVNGFIKLADSSEMVGFRRFLAEGHKPGAWCSTDGDRGATVFRAERIELDGFVATGVIFRAADARYQPQWVDFSRVFGLTGMEFKVARRLLDGLQIEAIANELKIAVGTARIHVRNLYGKLDVSSREAMFRLLLPYHIR